MEGNSDYKTGSEQRRQDLQLSRSSNKISSNSNSSNNSNYSRHYQYNHREGISTTMRFTSNNSNNNNVVATSSRFAQCIGLRDVDGQQHQHQHHQNSDGDLTDMLFHSTATVDSLTGIEDLLKTNNGYVFHSIGGTVGTSIFNTTAVTEGPTTASSSPLATGSLTKKLAATSTSSSNKNSDSAFQKTIPTTCKFNFNDMLQSQLQPTSTSIVTKPTTKFDFNEMFQSQLPTSSKTKTHRLETGNEDNDTEPVSRKIVNSYRSPSHNFTIPIAPTTRLSHSKSTNNGFPIPETLQLSPRKRRSSLDGLEQSSYKGSQNQDSIFSSQDWATAFQSVSSVSLANDGSFKPEEIFRTISEYGGSTNRTGTSLNEELVKKNTIVTFRNDAMHRNDQQLADNNTFSTVQWENNHHDRNHQSLSSEDTVVNQEENLRDVFKTIDSFDVSVSGGRTNEQQDTVGVDQQQKDHRTNDTDFQGLVVTTDIPVVPAPKNTLMGRFNAMFESQLGGGGGGGGTKVWGTTQRPVKATNMVAPIRIPDSVSTTDALPLRYEPQFMGESSTSITETTMFQKSKPFPYNAQESIESAKDTLSNLYSNFQQKANTNVHAKLSNAASAVVFAPSSTNTSSNDSRKGTISPTTLTEQAEVVFALNKLFHSESSTAVVPAAATANATAIVTDQLLATGTVENLNETQTTEMVIPKKPKRIRKRPNYEPVQKTFVIPTPLDVLMGRGGRTNHHDGNHRYLQAKIELQPRYLAASKEEKTSISQELVDMVHKWGGRFLKQLAARGSGTKAAVTKEGTAGGDDEDDDNWYIVANIQARKKASQTLRELNTPEFRAAKRAKYLPNRKKKGAKSTTTANTTTSSINSFDSDDDGSLGD